MTMAQGWRFAAAMGVAAWTVPGAWAAPLSQDATDAAATQDERSHHGLPPEPEQASEKPPSPFSFSLTYSLYSDYVFRGVNYSEYPGEGREKPNHQLDAIMSIDLGLLVGEDEGTLGSLDLETWFEWFADQKRLDPIHGGQNLQETDYCIKWSYDIEPLQSTFALGFQFYTYPNAHSANSLEWNVGLTHNDAWMWRALWPDNKEGVLNPSIAFYHDVKELAGASWLEFGFNHPFPIAEAWTITPSVLLAVDHRYLDRALQTGRTGSTRLAYIQYGLVAAYDLSSALNWPEDAGTVTLSAFLYFDEAVGNPRESDELSDELFGGFSIGWEF